MWFQTEVKLAPKTRGFHLVTNEIVANLDQLQSIRCGLLHLFVQHTSASLAINENADPSVRRDMEQFFMRTVPENADYFEHTLEGADDMPAHIKSVIVGSSLSIPVSEGRLALGTWQGIYLGEHRNHGGSRRVVATLHGERF